MACLGNHLIIDLYGCDFDEINSEKVISNYLDELVAILKTDIRKKIIYKFVQKYRNIDKNIIKVKFCFSLCK